jgi:hypothetical protein
VIEDGEFKTLAMKEGNVNPVHRANSPHTK